MRLVDRVLPYLDPAYEPGRAEDAGNWPEPPTRWSLSFVWRLAMLTLSGVVLVLSVRNLAFQSDFNGDLYAAGTKILHGLTPYNVLQLNHQAAIVGATGTTHSVSSPRWPMPVLLAASPLSLLPIGVADPLFFVLCVIGLVGGLRLLGVRDRRCHLVALVSAPAVIGILVGNISTLLVLGLALCWRLRSSARLSAASAAGLIMAKLFMWPLAVWLLITRRYRGAVRAGIYGTVSFLIAWSVVGFNGLTSYPTILRDVATIGQARGCSLVALLMYLGAPVNTARSLALATSLVLLLLAGEMARAPRGEARAFGLVILAALTSTPVVWSHYLVILFVPIALISPELSWLWFLPGLAAFAPTDASSTYGLAVLPVLLAELTLALVLCRPLVPASAARYWRSIVATARAAAPS